MTPLTPHYDVVVNPSLTNNAFNGTTGWTTSGNVSFTSGAALLNESTRSQTRINQVFTVGADDKTLRFTVSGLTLENPGDIPEDAFEAALLDANTGVSLLAPISLNRTDSFLNLQGDGLSFLSEAVQVIANADGSHTYIVDLSSVATGTAVNLSFDLLGFGQARSHLTIRDLQLGDGAPVGTAQTSADTAQGLEDTAIVIDALANDSVQAGFVPVLVEAPSHGQLTVNTDGTCGYTLNANYNGADHFTYMLSDGQTDSSVLAVDITITPVNDAPVAGNIQQTTRFNFLRPGYGYTLTYSDPRKLLDDLRGLGSTNADRERARGLAGKNRYRRMLQAYETMRVDGHIPATWEVVSVQAWGPPMGQPRRVGDREIASFSIDKLRGSRR